MAAQFKTWLFQVERHVSTITMGEISIYELADVDYHGMFDDELSPQQAAVWALEDAGFFDFSF